MILTRGSFLRGSYLARGGRHSRDDLLLSRKPLGVGKGFPQPPPRCLATMLLGVGLHRGNKGGHEEVQRVILSNTCGKDTNRFWQVTVSENTRSNDSVLRMPAQWLIATELEVYHKACGHLIHIPLNISVPLSSSRLSG